MRAFINSFHDYKRSWDSAFVLSLPALFGLIFTFIFSDYFYTALSSVFLRTADVISLTPIELLLAILMVIASIIFFSFTVVAISILIKERRTSLDFSSTKVRKSIEKHIIPIAFFFFILFIFGFLLQLLSLYLPILPLLHILQLAVFALLFFVPYAISIDNYKLHEAIVKSVQMTIKNPWPFIVWLAFGFVALVFITNLSFIIFGYDTGSYVSYVISSVVLLPFMTIIAAHLYMDRYPLA
jgi:hypothetical protein